MPKPPIGPATEKYVRYAATVPLLEVAWHHITGGHDYDAVLR